MGWRVGNVAKKKKKKRRVEIIDYDESVIDYNQKPKIANSLLPLRHPRVHAGGLDLGDLFVKELTYFFGCLLWNAQ